MDARDDDPVDLGRLTKPEADAFRYIALALGARFAGDAPTTGDDRPSRHGPPEPSPYLMPHPDARAAGAPVDQRAANLLSRVPIAVVVIVGDGVAFLNRAASLLFAYPSAAALDEAGGLGALFDSARPAAPGVVNLRTATGSRITARVTLTSLEWSGQTAMLFTVTPEPHTIAPVPSHHGTADALAALLDANPDPVAVIDRGGAVKAANAAFRALGPHERGGRNLGDTVPRREAERIRDVMHLAFVVSDATARTNAPLVVGETPYVVTVGALKACGLACLVFHPVAETRTTDQAALPSVHAQPRRPEGSALFRAVQEARRIVTDAVILLVSDYNEASRDDEADQNGRFALIRRLIVAAAHDGPTNTRITVRRRDDGVAIEAEPGAEMAPAMKRLACAERMTTLAGACGCTLSFDPATGLTVSCDSVNGRAHALPGATMAPQLPRSLGFGEPIRRADLGL